MVEIANIPLELFCWYSVFIQHVSENNPSVSSIGTIVHFEGLLTHKWKFLDYCSCTHRCKHKTNFSCLNSTSGHTSGLHHACVRSSQLPVHQRQRQRQRKRLRRQRKRLPPFQCRGGGCRGSFCRRAAAARRPAASQSPPLGRKQPQA